MQRPLNQALTPKTSRLLPALLLVLGLLLALGAAAYGYLESRRTEQVIIAVRDVPFGQQLGADDLGTIELPLHRPAQLAGIGDPAAVIGKWAARQIGPNDIVQSAMLVDRAPDQPVYPSGQQLDRDTVPIPFSTATIGPLTARDLVNVGYNAPSGDPQLCLRDGIAPANVAPASESTSSQPRPFACRLMQRLKVLYVDEGKQLAYLQMTPYQAHTIWALQAAGVAMWGERYGSSSDELPAMDRLDAGQISADRLTMTLSDTLKLYSPQGMGGGIPGSSMAVPGGTTTTPGSPPATAPAATPAMQKAPQ